MVTAYFLAEKQGNRKDLAIGLTVKNSYTLPCKKNLRMGATLWGIEVYGPDRSFGSIGILDRIRAPDYRPSRRNPYQCSDFNGGLPVPDVSAHVRLGSGVPDSQLHCVRRWIPVQRGDF